MRKKISKMEIVKIIFMLIVVFSVFGTVIYIYGLLNRKEEPVNVTVVANKIEGYDYYINDNSSEYYKSEFDILKEVYKQEEPKEEDIIKQIAKLYVIDLYSLNNKINKYEVTSSQYYYSSKQAMHTQKVIDNFYNLIIDNAYNDRTQTLPEVKKVECSEIKAVKYQMSEEKIDGYEVMISIEYQKDLGYDKKVKLTLVKDDNKYSIVSLSKAE